MQSSSQAKAPSKIALGYLLPQNFLAQAILEFEFLQIIQWDGRTIVANGLTSDRGQWFWSVQCNDYAWIVINSHRRPSITIWLPGFPRRGFLPKIASAFAQVSLQSTSVLFQSGGTIRATSFFLRMTSTVCPRATCSKILAKLV